MTIDRLIEGVIQKKNPCVAGIDPEWSQIPRCYTHGVASETDAVLRWALDVTDALADVVPAIKPQMAFFEVFGAEGIRIHQKLVRYAHAKDLTVVDDSKRNDIGNTARAYAYAHLATEGPINADFLTVSPFLGTDSLQPFIDMAIREEKGLFILVKTSNPSSAEISEARNPQGKRIRNWLAEYVNTVGASCVGGHGYSGIGAVVGATFPEEARQLRKIMKNCFFLVPGFGTQGGRAENVVSCFGEDGLGAIVSASRSILYAHLKTETPDPSREIYQQLVRDQAKHMQRDVYQALRETYESMAY